MPVVGGNRILLTVLDLLYLLRVQVAQSGSCVAA